MGGHPGFTLTAAATELDPKMNQDFCLDTNPATGVPFPLSTCPAWDSVPKGTQLPTVAKFKGNATARYTFPLGSGEIAPAGCLRLPELEQFRSLAGRQHADRQAAGPTGYSMSPRD